MTNKTTTVNHALTYGWKKSAKYKLYEVTMTTTTMVGEHEIQKTHDTGIYAKTVQQITAIGKMVYEAEMEWRKTQSENDSVIVGGDDGQ